MDIYHYSIREDPLIDYINKIDFSWARSDEEIDLFVDSLMNSIHDPIKVSHIVMMTNYLEDNSNNYVFSKPLTKTLMNTRANVSLDILPDDPFCYYFEMDGLVDTDGTQIEGILIKKYNFPGGKRRLEILYYTPLTTANMDLFTEHWVNPTPLPLANPELRTHDMMQTQQAKEFIRLTKPIEVKSVAIPYTIENADEKLEDAVVRVIRDFRKETSSYKGIEFKTEEADDILKTNVSFKTVINGLLYLLSGEENLESQQNEFSKKKSKREAQSKLYTPKEFYFVGKNVKFLREYAQDGYYWAPFFRKKANAIDDRKTIFVKGHFKYFKNKENH
jgi:hypothetical protein